MGREFFDAFLVGAMAICAIMALVWLLRVRSKGLSAWLMALAFVCFGGLCASLRAEAPQALSWTLGGAVALLLAADFAARAARDAKERDRGPQ